MIENNQATGVIYEKDAVEHTVKAHHEVLLSGGAFGSPKVLMLSVIGPAAHLQSHGIEVIVHAPDVGGNLQDHLDVAFDYEVNTTDVIGIGMAALPKSIRQWRKDGMLCYIRNKSDTIYHPIGTCRMGSDDKSVVDLEPNVRGVSRLRVIDAFIMPTLISANTNAPTIMIAEKLADLIKANHGHVEPEIT